MVRLTPGEDPFISNPDIDRPDLAAKAHSDQRSISLFFLRHDAEAARVAGEGRIDRRARRTEAMAPAKVELGNKPATQFPGDPNPASDRAAMLLARRRQIGGGQPGLGEALELVSVQSRLA